MNVTPRYKLGGLSVQAARLLRYFARFPARFPFEVMPLPKPSSHMKEARAFLEDVPYDAWVRWERMAPEIVGVLRPVLEEANQILEGRGRMATE